MADYQRQLDENAELIDTEDFRQFLHWQMLKHGTEWSESNDRSKMQLVREYSKSRYKGKFDKKIAAVREAKRIKRKYWARSSREVTTNNRFIYNKGDGNRL